MAVADHTVAAEEVVRTALVVEEADHTPAEEADRIVVGLEEVLKVERIHLRHHQVGKEEDDLVGLGEDRMGARIGHIH